MLVEQATGNQFVAPTLFGLCASAGPAMQPAMTIPLVGRTADALQPDVSS